MSEEHQGPKTHRNVEIGIDGKPFEVWVPAPDEGGPAAAEPATNELATAEPATNEPLTAEPATNEPLTADATASGPDGRGFPPARPAADTPPWEPATVSSSRAATQGFVPAPAPTSHSGLSRNLYAWLSIGLGGFALVSNMGVLLGGAGGLTWTAAFLLAAAGLYFGLRSGSVNSRGYSPQRSLRIAGIAISILAAVSTVAVIARFLMALSRIF